MPYGPYFFFSIIAVSRGNFTSLDSVDDGSGEADSCNEHNHVASSKYGHGGDTRDISAPSGVRGEGHTFP